MKKIYKKSAVILLTALFTSFAFAQEAAIENQEAEAVTEEITETAETVTAEESTEVAEAVEEAEEIPGTPVKTKKYDALDVKNIDNSFVNKIIGVYRYIAYDTNDLFTGTITKKINETQTELVVNVKTYEAGICTNYSGNFYHICFTDKGRQDLKKAAEMYLKDFENKNLDRKSKKTYKAYGSAKINMEWGLFKKNLPNAGEGDANFGYKFVNNKPYFMIQIPAMENLKDDQTHSKTTLMCYYLTKAQITDLAEKLTDPEVDEFLEAAYAKSKKKASKEEPVEVAGDDY